MVMCEAPTPGTEGLPVATSEGLALPVLLATLENGRIIDVRVVTHAYLLAHLAGDALAQNGGETCRGNAGDCRSRSG